MADVTVTLTERQAATVIAVLGAEAEDCADDESTWASDVRGALDVVYRAYAAIERAEREGGDDEYDRLVAIAEAAQAHRQLAAKLLEYCDPLSVPGFSESDERLHSLLEQQP